LNPVRFSPRTPFLVSVHWLAAAWLAWPGAAAAGEPSEFSGITRPVRQAKLSAPVPGTIQKVHVEEGSAVKAGDLLVELDKRIELLDVERKTILAESRAELDAASRKVTLLKSEWETSVRLFETSKSISKEDLDRKELEYKLAAAEQERLQALERQEVVEQRIAEEQLSRRDIRAPIDAIVTRVNAKEGEGCDPRQLQPLVELVDPTQCDFVCNAPVRQAARLSVGTEVRLRLNGGREPLVRTGRVVFVSPLADQASGLQEVKVRFANTDRAVSPGVDGALLLDPSPVSAPEAAP